MLSFGSHVYMFSPRRTGPRTNICMIRGLWLSSGVTPFLKVFKFRDGGSCIDGVGNPQFVRPDFVQHSSPHSRFSTFYASRCGYPQLVATIEIAHSSDVAWEETLRSLHESNETCAEQDRWSSEDSMSVGLKAVVSV